RLCRAGPDRYTAPQPLVKTLAIRDVQVHAGEFAPLRIVPTNPNRESILKGGDGPLAVFRPIAGETLPIGDGDIHSSGRPVLRVVFASPLRAGICKRGDGA